MAHNQDVIEECQHGLTANGRLSSQKDILPAPSLESTASKNLEARKNSKHGAGIDEQDLDLEAPQSSAKSGLEDLPSGKQSLRRKYRVLVHLFVWLVMTG